MKIDQILVFLVGIIIIVLGLEIAGIFDKEPVIGYTKKEVSLMLKVKDLNDEIKKVKIENQIIEKDNERIQKSANKDSVAIYDGSREYRDSLRAELFR